MDSKVMHRYVMCVGMYSMQYIVEYGNQFRIVFSANKGNLYKAEFEPQIVTNAYQLTGLDYGYDPLY